MEYYCKFFLFLLIISPIVYASSNDSINIEMFPSTSSIRIIKTEQIAPYSLLSTNTFTGVETNFSATAQDGKNLDITIDKFDKNGTTINQVTTLIPKNRDYSKPFEYTLAFDYPISFQNISENSPIRIGYGWGKYTEIKNISVVIHLPSEYAPKNIDCQNCYLKNTTVSNNQTINVVLMGQSPVGEYLSWFVSAEKWTPPNLEIKRFVYSPSINEKQTTTVVVMVQNRGGKAIDANISEKIEGSLAVINGNPGWTGHLEANESIEYIYAVEGMAVSFSYLSTIATYFDEFGKQYQQQSEIMPIDVRAATLNWWIFSISRDNLLPVVVSIIATLISIATVIYTIYNDRLKKGQLRAVPPNIYQLTGATLTIPVLLENIGAKTIVVNDLGILLINQEGKQIELRASNTHSSIPGWSKKFRVDLNDSKNQMDIRGNISEEKETVHNTQFIVRGKEAILKNIVFFSENNPNIQSGDYTVVLIGWLGSAEDATELFIEHMKLEKNGLYNRVKNRTFDWSGKTRLMISHKISRLWRNIKKKFSG